MLPPIFRPPPSSRSKATPRPINDNVISSHRQRDRDLHASGSYDPRDTPAEFRKARDGRRKHTTAHPPPSLRDIAEQAYDDLETGAEAEAPEAPEGEAPAEEPLASDDRPRDKSGRWVAKSEAQPGEAIAQPPPPADPAQKPEVSETRATEPDPALRQQRGAIRSPSTGAPKTKRPSPSCLRKDRPSS